MTERNAIAPNPIPSKFSDKKDEDETEFKSPKTKNRPVLNIRIYSIVTIRIDVIVVEHIAKLGFVNFSIIDRCQDLRSNTIYGGFGALRFANTPYR
jgi:hypothetical protein